jgi:hypothetical protein
MIVVARMAYRMIVNNNGMLSSCSITTVTRIFGNFVLNRVELCCRLNVKVLVTRLHVRRQLSPRVRNYLNSRLVHVRCHLTSRPLMTLRDVNS